MVSVRAVESATHEVVSVIAMGHQSVSAAWAMHVATCLRHALCWILRAHLDPALVKMVPVQPVQTPVVQIIRVAVVFNRRVAASFPMNMGVVAVDSVVRHPAFSLADQASLAQGAAPRYLIEGGFSLTNRHTTVCWEWTARRRFRCCELA